MTLHVLKIGLVLLVALLAGCIGGDERPLEVTYVDPPKDRIALDLNVSETRRDVPGLVDAFGQAREKNGTVTLEESVEDRAREYLDAQAREEDNIFIGEEGDAVNKPYQGYVNWTTDQYFVAYPGPIG